jgi:hypothetical protein
MITDEEFIELWSNNPSITEMSKIIGVNVRNVAARRRRIEERHTIKLAGADIKSPDFQVTYAQNNIRTKVDLHNGVIVVASDCHYWPGIVSTAHRALVKIIGDLKPKMVVINGDAFDGASISRHPPIGWAVTPSVKQELEACQERLTEIEDVARQAKLQWTWGNHDMRFNTRLSCQVGDTFKGIVGMNLTDHFAKWKFSTSIMVNDSCMIKHRWHNGIHAIYNNVLKSGCSFVTGHLHSLKVTPWTDISYQRTRYGVDTGTLACPTGDQFEYTEDNPVNHRSGFAVLTFYNGKLMPPELCEVINEDEGLVYFRGQVVKC